MKTVDTYEEEHLKDLQRIADFCLMDDEFMSAALQRSKSAVQLILRIILDNNDLVVRHSFSQAEISNLFGKSIILDVFCWDTHGRQYDIEIQRSDEGAHPLRARYYSSLIDSRSIDKGAGYDKLKENYVIFICENDIFQEQEPLYRVERTVLKTGLPFRDKQHIIYVNGSCQSDSPLGKLIHDLHCKDTASMHYCELKEAVGYYKETEGGVASMCRELEEMRAMSEKKGLEQGIQQGEAIGEEKERRVSIANYLRIGQTVEQIINDLHYPEALVREVAASVAAGQ